MDFELNNTRSEDLVQIQSYCTVVLAKLNAEDSVCSCQLAVLLVIEIPTPSKEYVLNRAPTECLSPKL